MLSGRQARQVLIMVLACELQKIFLSKLILPGWIYELKRIYSEKQWSVNFGYREYCDLCCYLCRVEFTLDCARVL